VRPFAPALAPAADSLFNFELVYGHRRHRACLELGLPVLVLIEATTDVELFEQMERENRGRKNLSAWEKGVMYRKAQDTKLYPSARQMADRLGLKLSVVAQSLQLVKFHPSVIAAFPSALSIQLRWVAPLAQAAKAGAKGLRERAQAIVKEQKGLKAADVFFLLVNEPQVPKTAHMDTSDQAAPSKSVTDLAVSAGQTLPTIHAPLTASLTAHITAPLTAHKSGQPAATLTTNAQGQALIRFEAGLLNAAKQEEVMQWMEAFLNRA
jgi:ParB family transcriptional regulator, chromosome partitioning protein